MAYSEQVNLGNFFFFKTYHKEDILLLRNILFILHCSFNQFWSYKQFKNYNFCGQIDNSMNSIAFFNLEK